MKTHLRKSVLAATMSLGAFFVHSNAGAAGAYDKLVWRSIAGITQPGNVVGTLTATVLGSGQPWSALGGHAAVNLHSGDVEFDVRGLVFAGGNFIGTPGTVEQVRATLVCNATGEASDGAPRLVDTPLVPLDDRGNAHFSGNVGPLPDVCTSDTQIAFLIRPANDRWIAYGAVQQ